MIGERHLVTAFIGSSSGMPSPAPCVIRGPEGRYSWEGQDEKLYGLLADAAQRGENNVRAEAKLHATGAGGWRWEIIGILPPYRGKARRR